MALLTRKLRLEKNIFLGFAVLMLMSNLMLAYKLQKIEIVTRNIPITEEELTISDSFINNAALKLRTDQILSLLFSLKKENISRVSNHLLQQIDNDFHIEMKKQIAKLAEDIHKRDYRYVFSDIVAYEYDNYNFTVRVKGYLETYLADKQINNQLKEFLLTFSNKSGIINLRAFEEIVNPTNGASKIETAAKEKTDE